MTQAVKFVYNGGTYRHRGVWHMVKDVDIEVIPARTTEYTSEYYNIHTVTHHPEHEVHFVRTMCGQPRNIVTGGLKWGRDGRYKRQEVTRKVEPPAYWPEGVPIRPSPLCSRCDRKADEAEG